LFARNVSLKGETELLDRPSEVIFFFPDRRVIVNIDSPEPFMVNKARDAVHTLSEIRF
jgi:hypothetical protein